MTVADPVDVFRAEAREVLDSLEQDLLDLNGALEDRALVDSVFRRMHTLKGSGAMFGFTALAEFTHHLETAFDRIRKGEVAASTALVSLVLDAMDHMRALSDAQDARVSGGSELLARLGEIMSATGQPVVRGPAPSHTYLIRFSLPANAFANGCNPLALLDELRELGECEVTADVSALPQLEALDPMECRLAWRVELRTESPRSAIEDVFIFVLDEMTLKIDEPESAGAAAPTRAHEETHPTGGGKSANRGAQAEEVVRVPSERLDEVMDRVGELVIVQSRLKQIAASSIDSSLRAVSEEVERLAAELRDSVMVLRMTPVSRLFGRFRRLVHELERETGKPLLLSMEGETTELDKTVIERLADPLVHLIRNAADHGIETVEERRAAGKPEAGCIMLAARQSGAEVIITVSDDGGGIHRDRVRAKAEQNGLLAPGDQVSDAALLQLIFEPGFSTAKTVTNLSGRGVGMDVVKRTVEDLRGSLEIESVVGAGSDVSLRIPLTLAIIDGLLVRVGGGKFVIPLSAVEECVQLLPEQDMRSHGRNLLTVRGQLVPFVRLRELFDTGTEPDPFQKIVIISHGRERIGLVVDQIIGDHQTVIKSLSPFHHDVGAFSGATILGDGGVALILDIERLVKLSTTEDASMRMAS